MESLYGMQQILWGKGGFLNLHLWFRKCQSHALTDVIFFIM